MADIKADIDHITAFRDGVGINDKGLVGSLSSTSTQYSPKLLPAPELGQSAMGHAFAEAKEFAQRYTAATKLLIGSNGSLDDLITHLGILHDAADYAASQYNNGVYTEANAAQTIKDGISNWTPRTPLAGV
jgi:hypothetical protein